MCTDVGIATFANCFFSQLPPDFLRLPHPLATPPLHQPALARPVCLCPHAWACACNTRPAGRFWHQRWQPNVLLDTREDTYARAKPVTYDHRKINEQKQTIVHKKLNVEQIPHHLRLPRRDYLKKKKSFWFAMFVLLLLFPPTLATHAQTVFLNVLMLYTKNTVV